MASLFLYGCTDSKNSTELKEANAKITQLTLENEKLQRLNTELIQKQDALLINHQELVAWTQKLVDGYGPGIWYMDESTLPIFVKPVTSGSIKEIIDGLNHKLKQDRLPLITLTRTQDNIAYVRIDDAEVLTQQMGTHGATSYINAVTYSLASTDEIDCVMFDFEEGDHAAPGKYCR